jgi:antitoxin component YwqK of YwqJK toxin-antitoxin module
MVAGEYDKGKSAGEWTVFDRDGKQVWKSTYRIPAFWVVRLDPWGSKESEGVEAGYDTRLNPMGSKSKEGLWTHWRSKEQKRSQGNYKGDNAYGHWVFWHGNGQIEGEGKLRTKREPADRLGSTTVELVGHWVRWYRNGQKESEGAYRDTLRRQSNSWNIRVGPWTEWHKNGQKKSKGSYIESAHSNVWREGVWTYWNEDGSINTEKSGIYKAGKRIAPLDGLATSHHPNGEKESEGEYKNGKKEGLWTYWNEDGSIDHEKSGIYKAGKRIAPLPKK